MTSPLGTALVNAGRRAYMGYIFSRFIKEIKLINSEICFLVGCSHIDSRDLREVSKLIGAGLTLKDIDEMVAEVDKDGDGKIQFDGNASIFIV